MFTHKDAPNSALPAGCIPMTELPKRLFINLYGGHVPAGFPSPADDHLEGRLDPTDLLVKRPAATFFCKAEGNSMAPDIHDGDTLVVDRSVPPQPGDIVVASVDGGLTVKRLERAGENWQLVPANPAYAPIPIDPDEGATIWGVVTFSISPHCQR